MILINILKKSIEFIKLSFIFFSIVSVHCDLDIKFKQHQQNQKLKLLFEYIEQESSDLLNILNSEIQKARIGEKIDFQKLNKYYNKKKNYLFITKDEVKDYKIILNNLIAIFKVQYSSQLDLNIAIFENCSQDQDLYYLSFFPSVFIQLYLIEHAIMIADNISDYNSIGLNVVFSGVMPILNDNQDLLLRIKNNIEQCTHILDKLKKISKHSKRYALKYSIKRFFSVC